MGLQEVRAAGGDGATKVSNPWYQSNTTKYTLIAVGILSAAAIYTMVGLVSNELVSGTAAIAVILPCSYISLATFISATYIHGKQFQREYKALAQEDISVGSAFFELMFLTRLEKKPTLIQAIKAQEYPMIYRASRKIRRAAMLPLSVNV